MKFAELSVTVSGIAATAFFPCYYSHLILKNVRDSLHRFGDRLSATDIDTHISSTGKRRGIPSFRTDLHKTFASEFISKINYASPLYIHATHINLLTICEHQVFVFAYTVKC